MIDSILRGGLDGLQKGLESAAKNATALVRSFAPGSTEDQAEAIIGLKLDETQVQASAAVVKVADELSDSLIDIIA